MNGFLKAKIEALRMSDAGTARGAARQSGWNGALAAVINLLAGDYRMLSADEFEELALMGMTKDQTLRLGEEAAARFLKHARALAELTGLGDVRALLVLNSELEKLRAGVREHRDARGDDRCWQDDHALYRLLPEGFRPPAVDSFVELERCKQFIACRQHPATEYVSPQRRIETLERFVKGLRRGDCWCEAGIDNPMMQGQHSALCQEIQAAGLAIVGPYEKKESR